MGSNEKDYIVSLVKKDQRIDGRKLDEYRQDIIIEYDVSESAEGSARVKIGETEVIAGIKMDIGEPYSDSPDKGVLITGAELLALSSPEFETGPPDQQTIELARIVDRGIRESEMIDFTKLCFKEGEKVWTVFLDIYTISDAGNLIDASALAAVAALTRAVFPKVEKEKVVFGEKSTKKLPLTKLPVTCTVTKIAEELIVDAISKEEKVADARLSIAISEDGSINALQKGGIVGLTEEEIEKALDLAAKKTKELRKYLGEKK